jgi:hypothetical protein
MHGAVAGSSPASLGSQSNACPSAQEQGDWAKQREEQEFNAAFQTLVRAEQYRSDAAFMERFRVWMRAKRQELDQQLDKIGR